MFPIFSNDVFRPRCVKLSWVQKIDQRLTTQQGKEKRLDEGDDIGLDTYSRGLVSMGSMGSAKPINFERRVLAPINFLDNSIEIHILTLNGTKIS